MDYKPDEYGHNELGRNYSLPINSHHFAMGPETERDATMAVNAISWLLLP
jgi:hypothetical protein